MGRTFGSKGTSRPRKYFVLVYHKKGYKELPWGYVNLEPALREAQAQRPSIVITKPQKVRIDENGCVILDSVTIVQKIEPELEVQF